LLVTDPPSSIDEASHLTTQHLLERARNGSDAAWEVVYRRYRRFLIFAIRMRISDFAQRQFDAEDVLQSAFLSAWKEIRNFEYRGEGSFRSWLRGIVINSFHNRLRAQERRHRNLREGSKIGGVEEVHASGEEGADPAQAAADADNQLHFLEKLRELGPEDQEILGMRIFERLAWADIGDILGCDRVTARRRCGDAVKRLEALLSGGGE
jgi:RNA polymerase sigma-70 factor, ECF subfamily